MRGSGSGPIFDRLLSRGAKVADRQVSQMIDSLARSDLPPGVTAEPSPSGIVLVGKRLRRRLIDDVRLRSFALLIKRMM